MKYIFIILMRVKIEILDIFKAESKIYFSVLYMNHQFLLKQQIALYSMYALNTVYEMNSKVNLFYCEYQTE